MFMCFFPHQTLLKDITKLYKSNNNKHLFVFKGILCDCFIFTLDQIIVLKEYYEIVCESRPLSAFFPKHADFFTEMHF